MTATRKLPAIDLKGGDTIVTDEGAEVEVFDVVYRSPQRVAILAHLDGEVVRFAVCNPATEWDVR